jgi:hypothetical protein
MTCENDLAVVRLWSETVQHEAQTAIVNSGERRQPVPRRASRPCRHAVGAARQSCDSEDLAPARETLRCRARPADRALDRDCWPETGPVVRPGNTATGPRRRHAGDPRARACSRDPAGRNAENTGKNQALWRRSSPGPIAHFARVDETNCGRQTDHDIQAIHITSEREGGAIARGPAIVCA